MTKRFRAVAVAFLLAGIIASMPAVRAQSAPLKLSITVEQDYAYFRVDDVPKFLLFISYFDAMRRHDGTGGLTTDFQQIRNRGFHGIRIFPNWMHYGCGNSTKATDDALFRTAGQGGTIRQDRLTVLKAVLDEAKSNGLLVNVSFSGETVDDNMDYTTYRNQLVEVATELAGTRPHVYFDISNEYTGNAPLLNSSQVATILTDIKNVDSARIVTISTGAGSEQDAGTIARTANLDVASPHDLRQPDLWHTSQYIEDAKERTLSGLNGVRKPIVFEEPMPISLHPFGTNPPCGNGWDPDASRHRDAAANAKVHGMAAWTFHTRTSFNLASATYLDVLGSSAPDGEKRIMGIGTYGSEPTIEAAAAANKWGVVPVFIDPTVSNATTVRAIHILELRARIDAQRARFPSLGSSYSWEDPLVPGATQVRAIHVTQLRTVLEALSSKSCEGWITYEDQSLTPSGTVLIKAVHVEQIRENLRRVERSSDPC